MTSDPECLITGQQPVSVAQSATAFLRVLEAEILTAL